MIDHDMLLHLGEYLVPPYIMDVVDRDWHIVDALYVNAQWMLNTSGMPDYRTIFSSMEVRL